MPTELKDKVVLITGSAQGMGREIALKLADVKADIALNDIQSQEENLRRVREELMQKGVKVGKAISP